MLPDRRFLLIDTVHALDAGEALLAVEGNEGLLFDDAGHVVHRVLSVEPVEGRTVGNERLSGRGLYHEVRLCVVQGVGNELVESVEDGQDDDEGRRSDGHARDADPRNDVDHIV